MELIKLVVAPNQTSPTLLVVDETNLGEAGGGDSATAELYHAAFFSSRNEETRDTWAPPLEGRVVSVLGLIHRPTAYPCGPAQYNNKSVKDQ
jgi:hypothetical protein